SWKTARSSNIGMSFSRSLKNLPTTTRCSSARFDLQRHVECLLLAQSGHSVTEFRCPLLGVKRTLIGSASMSAFDPKRTFLLRGLFGREVCPLSARADIYFPLYVPPLRRAAQSADQLLEGIGVFGGVLEPSQEVEWLSKFSAVMQTSRYGRQVFHTNSN